MNKQRGFTKLDLGIAVIGFFSAGLVIASVWALCHFIAKFW